MIALSPFAFPSFGVYHLGKLRQTHPHEIASVWTLLIPWRGGFPGTPHHLVGEHIESDDARVGDDHGAFDDVLQFADVARPAVRLESHEDIIVEQTDRLTEFRRVQLKKVLGQLGDVLGTLSQRRHVDRQDVEAEIEILADFP